MHQQNQKLIQQLNRGGKRLATRQFHRHREFNHNRELCHHVDFSHKSELYHHRELYRKIHHRAQTHRNPGLRSIMLSFLAPLVFSMFLTWPSRDFSTKFHEMIPLKFGNLKIGEYWRCMGHLTLIV